MAAGNDDIADDSILVIGGLRFAPGDRIGSYIYRRPIGKGAMAHVVLASDPDGQPIALKVLKSGRVGSGRTRFKREFRALARLRHPNVIRVDAFGDLHGHPFIAMEYVEGYDLHYAIQMFRSLPPQERWRRCEEVLVDLCRSLAYIHRRGLIHRDLKPSNVLLDHDRQCKLTDFGIVKDLDPDADSLVSTTLVGTWAYASPEQMNGSPIDHRSDLYSLGVILFTMLTGRRPFIARDLSGYLEIHRSPVIPSPIEFDPTVPAHLDEICTRLLRKLPRDRFRSAQEILYRLERLDANVERPEALAWTPALIGRVAEEEQLRGRTAALTRGQGGVVLIEGAEGLGKTRLLEIVAHQAELMGIPTHRLSAFEGDTPSGPVLRLAEGIVAQLGARTPARLTASIAALSEPGAAHGQARERLFGAMVEAGNLLLQEGPQVVLIDDLHHAPLPSIDALAWALRRFEGAEASGVLVVATLRPERVTPRLASLIDALGPDAHLERIRLRPLPRQAVDDLVLPLLGPGRAAAALGERLYRESEGNPLFLVAYVQNLMTHGIISRATGGWRLLADVEEITTGHFEVPPAVRQVVRARLDALDERELPLVEALAVNGREIDLDVLLDVLDLDEEAGADRVDALVSQSILRQRRTGQQAFVEFAHARYGDVVYRELDPERRAEGHRRLAAAFELRYQHAPAAAEAVGEHYRRAGEAGKAFHYLTAAAQRLRDKHQPADAWELSGRAQLVDDAARVDLPPAEYAAIKHALLQVRADILYHRGAWPEARDALEHALTLLPSGVDEAAAIRTHIRYGRVLRVMGQLEAAESEVRGSLDRARELHHRDAVAEGLLVLAGVAWGRGELDRCEALAQQGLVTAVGPALLTARAYLLLTLTAVQASRGQLASASAGLQEAQGYLKDLNMRSARAVALANLAEVQLDQGDAAAAWESATDALQEAEECGHRMGEGAAHGIRGLASLSMGVLDEARAEFEAALECAQDMGVPSELVAPEWQLARVDLEQGEPGAALIHLANAADAASQGDPEHHAAAIEALRAQALARTGDADAARRSLTDVESTLAGLPAVRRAQVSIDVARAWSLVGDKARSAAHAREALSLCAVRGFRLFALDALRLLAGAAATPAERDQLRADLRAQSREFAAQLPSGWQASFLVRMRLGA